MIGIDWIIGIALMFGLALVLNHYSFESLKGFFIYLLFFNTFVVWAGLLPFWTTILIIFILTFIMYSEFKGKTSMEG